MRAALGRGHHQPAWAGRDLVAEHFMKTAACHASSPSTTPLTRPPSYVGGTIGAGPPIKRPGGAPKWRPSGARQRSSSGPSLSPGPAQRPKGSTPHPPPLARARALHLPPLQSALAHSSSDRPALHALPLTCGATLSRPSRRSRADRRHSRPAAACSLKARPHAAETKGPAGIRSNRRGGCSAERHPTDYPARHSSSARHPLVLRHEAIFALLITRPHGGAEQELLPSRRSPRAGCTRDRVSAPLPARPQFDRPPKNYSTPSSSLTSWARETTGGRASPPCGRRHDHQSRGRTARPTSPRAARSPPSSRPFSR